MQMLLFGDDVATAKRTQTNYVSGASNFGPIEIEDYEIGASYFKKRGKVDASEPSGQTAHRVANLLPIKASRYNQLEANIQPQDYPAPTHDRQRLILACGMGTDSLGMMIAMHRRGIRPDVVCWADTGSERWHTYAYVNVVIAWLESVGWPPLLIVRRACPEAGHKGLADQLWNTEQLPSPAFHQNHSCSVKWKLDPQRDYHDFLPWLCDNEARTAIGFSAEETNRQVHGNAECVGFSAEEDGRKSYQITDEDGYTTFYPLQDWGITRAGCVELIADEKLPQPGKSSCFFCPMMKLCEVRELSEEQRQAAFAIEDRAEAGGKLTKTRGLRKGKDQKWSEWVEDYTEADAREFVGLRSDLVEGA